jgi:predicted HTH domain antitoxin
MNTLPVLNQVSFGIPDEAAQQLSAVKMSPGGALEALALEGYRVQTLTLYQVSEMLGLSRVETEDFLWQHHVPLSVVGEADLDREVTMFEAAACCLR